MALSKTIPHTNGIITEYHKIKKFSVNSAGSDDYDIHVLVSSYVSEETRHTLNDSEVFSKSYIIKVNILELESTPVLKLIYNKLKELDTFSGAKNI